MAHPLRCPASLPLAQMLDSSHAHLLRTANMRASDPLQQTAGAMQLLELLEETRRQCAERLQRQGRVTVGGGKSSSQSRAQSGRDSPRTAIPRNDSSSTVGGGSAASSPGQSATAAVAADELLVALPSINSAVQPTTGMTACSQSQTEEEEPLSDSAPEAQPETESATASSHALEERPSGPKSSGIDAHARTSPATTIVATSNLRPPDTLLVSPGEAATATAMDESADDEPSVATAITAAPATDLTRDSSDDSCVSVPGSWTAAATGSDGLVGVRLHRREAEQQEQPAGLSPRFDSSPAPAALRSSITSSANPLLEQLKAWRAALAVGPAVSSPPNLERAPSELAELLSKLTVARQRTGELAQPSEDEFAASSSGADSCDVPVRSAEEELQWLDELIAVVKRSISVEAEAQRPRPCEPVSPRAQSSLSLAPRVDSSAVWHLEQEYGPSRTLQDLLFAASPSREASLAGSLGSPAPQSFWKTLPKLSELEQDLYVFGSPPPSSTPASPWQPRATVIRHRDQNYRDAVTQTELTGSWLDYCAEECRKAVYRAEATADTAAPAAAAAAAAPASFPPMGLACTHSLRSKQVGAAAAAAPATNPVASGGQVTPAARTDQQDSAAMHDGDAQPERVAAAASKATQAAKARLTRSQSGVVTLPAPPARETSGTKRSRLEPSESLHAQITLKDQLAGATAAAGSAAAATDASPTPQPVLTSPAKRRKSVPTAAQQAQPASSPALVAPAAPKQNKAAPKASKSSAKAKTSAPSESESNASAAAATAPASPAKAAASKSRATSGQGDALANAEPQTSVAESADLKSPTPEESAVVEASQAKAEVAKLALPPPIASSPSKNKAKGRKDLLRVGGIKRSKYEAAEPPNAAKDASMQADSGAAAEIDEGPTASAAAAASTATDAAAGAHSSDLSSPLFSSAPPKPTKGEQKLAREAETATNAQKLWDIVRSQNLPNTVSPAELRELMGWSPQKVASGIKDILSHWATDGRGPPTPEWKTYNRPRKGASPSKATTPKIKSDAAPSAAATSGRANSDGSIGKNKFEEMCAELARSADPGAVATLESSLQPEQLLAGVRAEIALEDAGAETAVENMQLSESMSDAGPSSQSASPLQGSTVSTVSTISSPMLQTAGLNSDTPSAPSDADADVQMHAAEADEVSPAPGSSSPAPSSSTEPTHLAMHTRIDKRHISN